MYILICLCKHKTSQKNTNSVKLCVNCLRQSNWPSTTWRKKTLTDQDEIHINKQTRLFEPASHEISFNIQQLKPVKQENSIKMIPSEVLIQLANCKMNISGWITLKVSEETITSKGKTLRKQEALFIDNTATVWLVLWENDIDKIATRNSYNLSNVVIWEYNKENYLCFNCQSVVAE